MTKYKQIEPKSETENYFKVGDTIKVYDRETTIQPIKVDKVDGIFVHHNGNAFSFLQCRKLEEVKPPEYYLCRKCNRFARAPMIMFCTCVQKDRDLVIVREVTND